MRCLNDQWTRLPRRINATKVLEQCSAAETSHQACATLRQRHQRQPKNHAALRMALYSRCFARTVAYLSVLPRHHSLCNKAYNQHPSTASRLHSRTSLADPMRCMTLQTDLDEQANDDSH